MPDLGQVSGKLASLIRLLGSDCPGEVVAAAAAIKRVLATAGADMHALAEAIQAPAKLGDADMRKLYDAGHQEGYKHGFQAGLTQAGLNQEGFDNTDGSTAWDEIANFCHNRKSRLSAREREFVDDMLRWTKRKNPTEKQERWLRSIYSRLGGAPI